MNEPNPSNEGVGREMPRYKCHKIVHALKIERVVRQIHPEKDDVEFRFIDKGFAPIVIEAPEGMRIRQAMLNKDKEGEPLDTGYLVVYKGGYRSWSPTKEFEEGYTDVSKIKSLTVSARLAVTAILMDLEDRRGLRQEWEQIDEEIQQEIHDKWLTLVNKAFENYD